MVLGEAELVAGDAPPELDTILGWADAIRHGKNRRRQRLGVRANADTGADAARARELGAEGIGLCRTEHMFLGEDRLPVVREMILADTEAGEARALEKLLAVQREDFVAILEAMDGLPVTVRLLDPPLHEFLPEHRGAGDPRGGRGPVERGEGPAGRGPVVARAEPDARHPGRAPRRGQARPLRHAGAGAGRGGARAGQGRAASRWSRS